MKITRTHDKPWGRDTRIQIKPGSAHNNILVEKRQEPRAANGDPATWMATNIIVVEQHLDADEAAILQQAISEAIKEAKYMDEKWPEGSAVAA